MLSWLCEIVIEKGNEVEQLIQNALSLATIGQLSIEIQRHLARNTEIKIKPQWIRVQHTSHNDKLLTPEAIDKAIEMNLVAN